MTLTIAQDQTRAGLAQTVESTYRIRTLQSRALHERAVRSLPGGSTRAGTFYLPYPTYMARGRGCRLTDVDDNVYIDCLSNYTSLIHGHAHPGLMSTLSVHAARGTAHGAPVEAEIALAELITQRVPSVEQLRFTNSGTEAVMSAIRAARAATGRSKVLKMEGGYHGSYDAAEVSVDPGLDAPAWPTGRPDGAGISPGLGSEVLVAPFNDLATASELIDRHRRELAAVIVEPVMTAAGVIPQPRSFFAGCGLPPRRPGCSYPGRGRDVSPRDGRRPAALRHRPTSRHSPRSLAAVCRWGVWRVRGHDAGFRCARTRRHFGLRNVQR